MGYEGVYISRTCFPEVLFSILYVDIELLSDYTSHTSRETVVHVPIKRHLYGTLVLQKKNLFCPNIPEYMLHGLKAIFQTACQ